VNDPTKIVADLAVAVALGGACLADAAVLRAEPALAGPVASDPVISRLISRLAADTPAALTAIGKARAAARGPRPGLAASPPVAPGAGGRLITAEWPGDRGRTGTLAGGLVQPHGRNRSTATSGNSSGEP